jgi:hypothetical protein
MVGSRVCLDSTNAHALALAHALANFALRRCSLLSQLTPMYDELLEALVKQRTKRYVWIWMESLIFVGPFAPARTWVRQSTEKLRQDAAGETVCHVGCWWSHWLDGMSSASVPSSCLPAPQAPAQRSFHLHIPDAVAACAPAQGTARGTGPHGRPRLALRLMRRREVAVLYRKSGNHACSRT